MHQQSISLLLLIASLVVPCHSGELTLAIMHGNKQQRDNFAAVLRNFQAQSGISVQLRAYTDSDYKAQFLGWLTGAHSPDLLYWQGGERLLSYAKSGALQPLGDLWRDQNWTDSFGKNIQNAVSWQGQAYALPYSTYHWGVFYSRSALQRAGVSPPTDWPQLLQSCRQLRHHGITPLVLGTKEHWPALAWFDYLNLRLNGLEFHQQLTQGQIDYRDPRVKNVFSHWQQLIQAHCFNNNISTLDWNDGISYLYYGKGAMTLMGSFAIPMQRSEDIRTMPFPTLNSAIPRYEDAPLDLFVLPARPNPRLDDIKQLLIYLGRPEVQLLLNRDLGTFSPHTGSSQKLSPMQQASRDVLGGAAGVVQYFDREVPPAFDRAASPVIAGFAVQPDIDATVNRLEALRQQHYPTGDTSPTVDKEVPRHPEPSSN